LKRWTLLLTTLVLYTGALQAADIRKTPTQYLILKPSRPITIDGKLDEWDMANTPYKISATSKDPLNDIHSNDPTNSVKGDDDFSGRAALAWDETYLYVAGEMVDDHLLGVKPDSFGNQGPPGWGCDSLMVAVASYRQPMKTNSPFQPTPFIGVRYAPTGASPRGKLISENPGVIDKRDLYWVLTENSKWGATETPKGYNVEAAIPWKDLEFVARPGETLFIAFLAADIDPDEALNQVGWAFKGDPKDHPIHRLADRADVLGSVTVSSDEVPANATWAVRVGLDAVKGEASLDQVRVVDPSGKVATEKKLGVKVSQGMTGVEVIDIGAGAVSKPGAYAVEAVVSIGGKSAVIARAPVKIVEAKPEPPTVKNLPGEIHHMGPDRVAHNAFMEHREGFYKHNFVKSSEDYIPYIRKYVEPGLKGAVQQAIKTKSPWGYVDSFRCMALYKLTKDEEYVQLARDVMDYTLDAGDLGWFKLTAMAQYR